MEVHTARRIVVLSVGRVAPASGSGATRVPFDTGRSHAISTETDVSARERPKNPNPTI